MQVGREDEIKEAGTYIAVDTQWTGPITVSRTSEGTLAAWANVCRHRGAKVVPDGVGRGSKVVRLQYLCATLSC